MPQTCLVNLFHLDPAHNGGSSRIAREVSTILADYAKAQQLRVIFAVGWRFAEAFHDWLGYPQACVIPCLPEAGITPLFRSIRPDMIISPLLGTTPFVDPADYGYAPHVAAMPEISLAITQPELLPAEVVQARLKLYQQLPEATRIVTLSEYARQGIIQDIGVSPQQIVVVPTIGSLLSHPKAPVDLEPEASRPYLFYPANGWPHKRHALLLRIMQEVWQVRPDMRLVLAGQFEAGFIANLIEQHSAPKDRVINLGYIEDKRLSGLYHYAEALLHVSEFEGFGIPLVEAMAYGCPIICAPLTAIPEVAGEAALYVNSDNPVDWANAILEELPEQRASLIAKGLARSTQFSWARVRLGWLRVLKEAGLELSISSASDDRQIWLPAEAVAAELKLWSGYHLRQYQELEAKEAEIQSLAAAVKAHIAYPETKEVELQSITTRHTEVENLVEQLNMQKGGADSLKIPAQSATEQLIAKEAFIQEQYREMVAKEAVIQSLKLYRMTSFYYWLQRLRTFLRFLIGQSPQHMSRVRQLDLSFKPKIGQLYHYPARPIGIPASYYRANCASATAPTISIVTPSFNQAAFLEQTVKSILEQAYPRLEYMIQDGGSTDGALDILNRYRSRLSHIESRPDKGQAHAINLGFARTTGEIMAWLNSDDLLLPGALSYIASFFVAHPEVDVVYGHRILIDDQGQEIGRWVLPPHDPAILLWADYVPQETLFWRRAIWEKAGGYVDESYKFAIDWELLLRFQDAGAKMVRLPRFLGAFRVHDRQKTSAQLAGIGQEEMRHLRRRCHGRSVSHLEIGQHIGPYLVKSIVYHKLYRAGILRY